LQSTSIHDIHNTKKNISNIHMSNLKQAAFGAGCFWGTEKFMANEFKDSISEIFTGYMGGQSTSPTYEEVCSGQSGHAEVIWMTYDSKKVSFETLTQFFYRFHDPTTLNRQGNDRGSQYRSAIFYYDDEQLAAAQKVTTEVNAGRFNGRVTTQIAKATTFYKAEDYHQEYLKRNPGGYCNHSLR
jgi:peptide-methionine (S)-S-oxide reductase